MKKALITGITGQDGSYLSELLLSKKYKVHGLVRRVASEDSKMRFSRLSPNISKKITFHSGDITDYPTIWRLIESVRPDEVYHLAAQSFVKSSFEDDFSTFQTNLNGTHFLLSAIKEIKPDTKFYFAATSEMFGQAKQSPQDESTPFGPVSPYAISKLAAYNLTRMYRNAYGIPACNGILFNHESPRRGFEFVTRKISSTVAKIKLGMEKELRLGNIEAKRDWGFAGDYVRAMWLMLQKKPDDYVVGTGENHSVKEFVNLAFDCVGLDWRKHVRIDKKHFRPTEVHELRANPRKARKALGWKPSIGFEELVALMVAEDLKFYKKHG